MRQAFFLTVLLLAVVAAMFVLKRKAETGPGEGGLAGKPANSANHLNTVSFATGLGPDGGMRVVTLTRLLPSYAVELPAQEADGLREQVVKHLGTHGGRVLGALPADPRAPFPAEIPHAAFKKLLRELGLGTRPLRVTPTGDKPHTGGPAMLSLTLSLPAPTVAPPGATKK